MKWVTGTQARLHKFTTCPCHERKKYNYICTNFRELLTAGASAGQIKWEKERRMQTRARAIARKMMGAWGRNEITAKHRSI